MKESEKNTYSNVAEVSINNRAGIVRSILTFLHLFMTKTLTKRIVSIILIVADVPISKITEMTGLNERSVRDLKKALETGGIAGLLTVGGGGRKSKLCDVEDNIVKEIELNNYSTRQQIADMIEEKFSIKVSLPAVGRLLKKTGSRD